MSDLFNNSNQPNPSSTTLEKDFLNPESKVNELVKEIDWVITQRKNEYLHDILKLTNHKSVQVRRKIANGLIFLVKKDNLYEVKKWQENESDRQTWVILESLVDKIERGVKDLDKDVKILTVSEAIALIKQTIGDKYFTIEGEISEAKAINQMYYLTLKDDKDTRLNCWAFRGIVEKINFPLNEGLSVRITGKFKLSKDSRIYLEVKNLELTGEGELLRNLKLLEEKLEKEGLFDAERKRPIPQLPKNVLLIASPNSAAVADFLKVCNQRRGGLNIHLLPIKTQGVSAEFTILEQLKQVNRLTKKYNINTVVITRGGGGKDDLFVFNSEKIVRALHGINRPVIAAIGHERDETLAELVADLRCSTPSQAAEKTSLSQSETSHQINTICENIKNRIRNKIDNYQTFTNRVFTYITGIIRMILDRGKQICNQTNQLINSLVSANKAQTNRLYQSILWSTNNRFNKLKSNFQILTNDITSYDPKKILEKGYAMILQKNNVITQLSELNQTEDFTIRMKDGESKGTLKN